MTVSPTTAVVGTTVTFNGTSYAAKSPVSVSWSQGTACTATTNAKGTFSCSYTIPQMYIGGQTFTGTDGNSGAGSATFTIVPQMTVSPTSGPAGTSVTFTGTGFQAAYGGSQYAVTWQAGSVTACHGGGSGVGSWSCTYTIPAGTSAGSYTFTGSDPYPHTATARFTVGPELTLNPPSGLVGSVVGINGTSYAASSSVIVQWSGGTACTSTTDAGGSFSCNFTVPSGTSGGVYTFTGTDSASNKATASFTDPARLSVTPLSDPVGKSVTFKGTGYAGGLSVLVNWSGGTACTATTNGAGVFSCTFRVPATPAGSYIFNGTDANTNTATAKFRIASRLVATPTSGTVGSVAIFSGTGYSARSSVTVGWTGGTACTATTSAVGSFSCTFTLPQTAGQLYTFTATDTSSRKATTTFTVNPSLKSSPSSGPTGTSITFNGTGYAGSSAVTVSWTNGTACLAITNTAGSFNCTFTIPAGTALGSYVFTATDASFDVATVTFKVK
jgi:hypothetical protein